MPSRTLDGVDVIRVSLPRFRKWFGGRALQTLIYYWRVLPHLAQMHPDAVHCANLDMLFLGVLYKKWFNPSARVVYEVADLHPLVYNQNNGWKAFVRTALRFVERRLCKRTDLLIVTSEAFVHSYFGAFVDKDKVLFQPNTPERHLFEGFTKRPQSEDLVVGVIGVVRYPDQIRMLIDVSERIPGVQVFIAGDGPDFEAIKAYCENKGHVCFYGRYDYEKEIRQLYQRVDCVFAVYDTRIPNVRVALPNRLYEAIVCGLPIIAAEGTFLATFCLEQGIGYPVSDRDPSQLENLLRRLRDDRSLLEKVSNRAQAIRELYYADTAQAELLARYRMLLSRTPT